MSVERKPGQPDLEKLRFFRWMAEQGRLERPVEGKSTGEFKPTLRLKVYPNGTHYVEARTEAEWRAAKLLKLEATLPK